MLTLIASILHTGDIEFECGPDDVAKTVNREKLARGCHSSFFFYIACALCMYSVICLFLGCLSVCLCICLFVCLSICLSVYLSICLSVYLSVCLSVFQCVCLSVC